MVGEDQREVRHVVRQLRRGGEDVVAATPPKRKAAGEPTAKSTAERAGGRRMRPRGVERMRMSFERARERAAEEEGGDASGGEAGGADEEERWSGPEEWEEQMEREAWPAGVRGRVTGRRRDEGQKIIRWRTPDSIIEQHRRTPNRV